MQYDEKHFKKSANRKALVVWLVLGLVLSGAYAVEIVKGLREMDYYIRFLLLCWVPFVLGLVLLRIKGMHTDTYKYVIALGYGAFYIFVLVTTTSPLAFVYLLPLTSMLTLYKNRNFMIICGIANLFAIGLAIYINLGRGLNSPSDITQYEIQVACILLCYTGYILSINHLNLTDGAIMGSLQQNLDKVVNTVETVKIASNDIMDGVSTVRELADENITGANDVVNNMAILTSNNAELQQSTSSSFELTEAISTQVQNVASKIARMVELASESVAHAQTSSEELSVVVDLSSEVEEVLHEFKNQFKTMADEIHIIESITMQTNILSLNASVEAARAGAAGKGFAVVAGEIRELSSKTKTSSDSIFSALQHLENTSLKMTESITKTLEKVKQVNQSVSKITIDTTQMGEDIKIIDSAVVDVTNSNSQLVDNMQSVSNVVERMTQSIGTSETTTKDMLAKNIETTKNVADVEATVGRLMQELGVIGVMGIKDIMPGQYATVKKGDNEYKIRILETLNEAIAFEFTSEFKFDPIASYDFIATIDNSYYRWDAIKIVHYSEGAKKGYKALITKQPSIVNRRKYKRVPIDNKARITLLDSDHICHGRMINLSEGGFAFMSGDPKMMSINHKVVRLHIEGLAGLADSELDAKVIRVGGKEGDAHIGCRFLYDNMELKHCLEGR